MVRMSPKRLDGLRQQATASTSNTSMSAAQPTLAWILWQLSCIIRDLSKIGAGLETEAPGKFNSLTLVV